MVDVHPLHRLARRVAAILCTPNEARTRLAEWTYLTPNKNNVVGRMNAILPEVIAAEPVERKFLKALKSGQLKSLDALGQLAEAEQIGAISAGERALLERVREATLEFINVDDFDPAELAAGEQAAQPSDSWRQIA